MSVRIGRALCPAVVVALASACLTRDEELGRRPPDEGPALAAPAYTTPSRTLAADNPLPDVRAAAPSAPSPRVASEREYRQAAAAAVRLRSALREGRVAPREVCAVLDIHGHRFLRRRRYPSALAYFFEAVATDATFEPALFNGLRAACQLKELALARHFLGLLQRRDTPLGRERLKRAATLPECAGLRRGKTP